MARKTAKAQIIQAVREVAGELERVIIHGGRNAVQYTVDGEAVRRWLERLTVWVSDAPAAEREAAAKALVAYLKEKLAAQGVTKLPRDWHLRQLSTARTMLDGPRAPGLADWCACIDWAFSDTYWMDKVDHLATVARLWPKYALQHKPGAAGGAPSRASYRDLYV
ncbi:MAG: hypothetical protein QME76_12520 [Bacillota bacterium]|nr:hypothetical protein [Bacillota bacterium]